MSDETVGHTSISHPFCALRAMQVIIFDSDWNPHNDLQVGDLWGP